MSSVSSGKRKAPFTAGKTYAEGPGKNYVQTDIGF